MTKNEAYLTTIYGAAISAKPCDVLPEETEAEALYALAKKHGIANALYYSLRGTAFEPYFEKAHTDALQRNSIRIEEETRVFAALEKADISYLPLKGSAFCLYYPSTDMRDMAVTDLMVDTYARKDARRVMESCGYKTVESEGNSDVYKNENGNVYELYFKPKDASDFHKKLMETALPVDGHGGRLSLSYSDFYVYIISDMASRIQAGRVSLRELGDVKVFYSRCGGALDEAYVDKRLEEMGLLTFEKGVKKLIYVLFYGTKGDRSTTLFANYIFSMGKALTKEQKSNKKELFVALGIAHNKNGKQRMSGSDIALTVTIILLLIFSIVFISTIFFQKEGDDYIPPQYSEDDVSSEDEVSEDSMFVIPEQNYATIPYRNGVYKGYVSDGLPNGAGELALPNGEKYIGSFSNGQFNGNGIYYYLNGTTFDGMWFEGEINGSGTLTFADGSYIYGDFVNGTPQGVCVYQNVNGDVYEGELKDGKRVGMGRFSWANGDIYEGYYVDGEREGHGKYVHCNGNSYEGDWVASAPNGSGVMSNEKATFTGVFIQGVLEGEGSAVYKNGDVYKGYFVHGKCDDDSAVYTFKDGSKYEGAFENDKFNGKGKFTYADGDVVTGTFENGLLQGSASYYDKSTGRTRYVTYKDGKPV